MHLHQPDRIMGPSMKQTSNALAAQGSPATVRLRRCMGRARAAVCGAGLRLHLVEMVAELSELVHELQHGERAVTWRAELLET